MLHTLHAPPKQHSENPPVLVMLHGRGADEHDLFGLKEMLDPRLEVYSLRAPFPFLWGGYTWFEMKSDGSVDAGSYHTSRKGVLEFLETLKGRSVILMGFSMGAIMSYSLALTMPGLCKGIACLSGFAPPQLENEYLLQKLQDLHIFIAHGIHDQIIPVSMPQRTKELLSHSNATVTYKEYPMGHEISEACLQDLKEWMTGQI